MITIRSEEDLHALIEQVADKGWDDTEELRFDGFPRFDLVLRGERFDGGVPTRIMPALLEIQRAVDRAARQVSGRSQLSKEQLRSTEIVVRTGEGSTGFVAEIWPIFNRLASQMTGTEALIAIIACALMLSGVAAWRYWLSHRREMAALDRDLKALELGEKQAEAFEKLSALLVDNPAAQQVAAHGERLVRILANRMADGDELVFPDGAELSATALKQAVQREPELPVDHQESGDYLVLSVESGLVKGDGLRVRVRRLDNDEELTVAIPVGAMAAEHIEALKSGEWGKQPLRLELIVTRAGNRVRRATVVRAALAQQ